MKRKLQDTKQDENGIKRAKVKQLHNRFEYEYKDKLTMSIIKNTPPNHSQYENAQEILLNISFGDIIDTMHWYRGFGLYLYDGKELHESQGEYGYFLPYQAWPLVQKHGLAYYDDIGCEYFLIERGAHVLYCDENKSEKQHQWIMSNQDVKFLQPELPHFPPALVSLVCGHLSSDSDKSESRTDRIAVCSNYFSKHNKSDYVMVNGKRFDASVCFYFD